MLLKKMYIMLISKILKMNITNPDKYKDSGYGTGFDSRS